MHIYFAWVRVFYEGDKFWLSLQLWFDVYLLLTYTSTLGLYRKPEIYYSESFISFLLFQFPDIYIPKRDLLEVEEVETYALKNAETHRTEKYELVRNSQVSDYLLFA